MNKDIKSNSIAYSADCVEKKSKKEAKGVKELLENLVRLAPGVLYQYQLFPDGSSCFPYASEGIYEIYEVTPEEVIEDASKVYERLHYEDYDQVVGSIKDSAKNLSIWHEEYRVDLPKKGIRWVEGIARPEKQIDGSILWHGNIKDITERKKQERTIAELHKVGMNFQNMGKEDDICQMTIETANKILKFDLCHVSLLRGDFFVPIAATEEMDAKIIPVDSGIAGKTFRNNKSYLVLDAQNDSEAFPTSSSYKSGISVPIKGIGVFQAIARKKNAFNKKDVEVAENLIFHTSSALERIYAEKKIRENNIMLTGILESIQDGITVLDPDLTIRYANSKIKKMYTGKSLTGKKCYKAYHSLDRACKNCLTIKSLKSGMTEKTVKRYSKDNQENYLEIYSYPIFDEKKEQVTGVVEVVRDITESMKQKKLLEKTSERLNQEINKAKKLHESTLPTEIPELKGLKIYSYYKPATEIGGDFYNFIEVGGKLLFYLIDTTGHSLDSSIISLFVKNIIGAYISLLSVDTIPDPKSIIDFIFGQNALENFLDDYFITMILGIIDPEEKNLIYSSAGMHVPPLICNNEIKELPAGGLPISKMISDKLLEYQNTKVNLSEGATLFFSTDGLSEQSNGTTLYGDRYKNIILNNNSFSPAIIAEEINKDFSDFYNGPADDDITYLIIKIDS